MKNKTIVELCLISCALFSCSNQKELETYKILEKQCLKLDNCFEGDTIIGICNKKSAEEFTRKIKDEKVLFLSYFIVINNKSEYFLIAGEKNTCMNLLLRVVHQLKQT